MKKLIKELEGIDGALYGLCDGSRFEICKCNAHIEIIEEQINVPVLNRNNSVKKQYLSIAISQDMEYSNSFDWSLLEKFFKYEMNIHLERKDGVYIPVRLDLEKMEVNITLNEWTFLINEDFNTIKYLMNL